MLKPVLDKLSSSPVKKYNVMNILKNRDNKTIVHEIVPFACADDFKLSYVFQLVDLRDNLVVQISVIISYSHVLMKPVAVIAKNKIKKYVMVDVPSNITALAIRKHKKA